MPFLHDSQLDVAHSKMPVISILENSQSREENTMIASPMNLSIVPRVSSKIMVLISCKKSKSNSTNNCGGKLSAIVVKSCNKRKLDIK